MKTNNGNKRKKKSSPTKEVVDQIQVEIEGLDDLDANLNAIITGMSEIEDQIAIKDLQEAIDVLRKKLAEALELARLFSRADLIDQIGTEQNSLNSLDVKSSSSMGAGLSNIKKSAAYIETELNGELKKTQSASAKIIQKINESKYFSSDETFEQIKVKETFNKLESSYRKTKISDGIKVVQIHQKLETFEQNELYRSNLTAISNLIASDAGNFQLNHGGKNLKGIGKVSHAAYKIYNEIQKLLKNPHNISLEEYNSCKTKINNELQTKLKATSGFKIFCFTFGGRDQSTVTLYKQIQNLLNNMEFKNQEVLKNEVKATILK